MKSVLVGILLLLSPGVPAQQAEHVPSEACPKKRAVQQSPYVGLEERPIKALSDQDRERLLAGHGMGLALAAELNRFPGPKHVLELSDDLQLSADQVRETEVIFAEMSETAQRLGRDVVTQEAYLDERFASGEIDEAQLSRLVREIGRLRGELRLVHLRAHLAMRAAMTETQIARYDHLRGYATH